MGTQPFTGSVEAAQLDRREHVGVVEERSHLRGERTRRFGAVEQVQRILPAGLAQLAEGGRLQRFEGVQHPLARTERPTLERAERQVHGDEDHVDERDRRLPEVVDVARDKLAQLVDEPSEACAPQHRDEGARRRAEVGDRPHDGNPHHHGAPDRVRDVERPVPELRVAGDHQERAVSDHRADRDDQEDVEVMAEVRGADREPRP